MKADDGRDQKARVSYGMGQVQEWANEGMNMAKHGNK